MLLPFLLLVVQVTISSSAVVFSLNGEDWTLSGPNSISVNAHVPGGVYTDLLRNKKIDDPYFRMNDVSLRWVAMANWTYTKTFQVDDAFAKHKHIDLVSGGLDTVAEVYLNDILVLQANNMFRRYVKDVKKVIKSGQNMLRILFLSPVTYAEEQAKKYPYKVPPDCPPPVQNGECHFNFIRKEAASFSWDWGPSFPSMGIWKNITLEAYEGSVLRYVNTDTKLKNDVWLLQVNIVVNAPSLSSPPINGHATIEIPEIGLTYHRPIPTFSGTFEEIIVIPLSQVVEAWWPNGLGQQKLYDMIFTLNNSVGDVDRRKFSIGFRTVELVEDAVGGDEPGYTFYFKINGIPVFVKGSNWIPADSFQERITPAYLERLLTSTAEANMNMLRVWGGGVYESEEFYSLTDRLGIMIWQDFMFACALYPVDSDFLANVQAEVVHQVQRLKRHPSIVLWSANNENEGALAENWFGISPSDFEKYREDYIQLYIDVIGNFVEYEDSTRPFVPSSPSNGLETLEEGYVAKDPQSVRYGDIHYYTYEDDTWNWKTFPMPRFASEFGIQSWCSMETLAPVSLPPDWDLDSDFVAHRQHHDNGNEQIRDEIAMHMKLPTATNRTKRFIDFIYLSQINQAVGIKTEVEFYRRSQNLKSSGLGLTMGALYWQLNDIWQGPTWASIEYGGKWKMLHYYAKRFYRRTLLSPYLEDGLLKLYYVNDDVWTKKPQFHYENLTHSSSGNLKFADAKAHAKNSLEVHEDVVVMRNKAFHMQDEEAVVRIVCYHWSSLEEQTSWQITFQNSTLASKCIYISRLSDMLRECNCPDASHCFFYFDGYIPGVTNSIQDNHLFPMNLSSVVGLERANVEVTQIYDFNSTFAKIILTTDRISPFTWLEAEGFSGRFSDNGFLMVTSELQVTFSSWEPIDWNKFRRSLTVRTFLDVYDVAER